MDDKTKAIIMLLVVLLLGAIIGYFASAIIKFPPSDHQEIIDELEIRLQPEPGYSGDVQKLMPEFVGAQTKEAMAYRLLDVNVPSDFVKGELYAQSQWNYVNKVGDIEAIVVIWGPDESGDVYSVEVSRSCSAEITVTYETLSYTMPIVTDWTVVNRGYIGFNIEL